MTNLLVYRDVIRIIAGLLDLKDIVAVGVTCLTCYHEILQDERIWYAYIITNWPSSLPQVYRGFKIDFLSWRRLIVLATKFVNETLHKRVYSPMDDKLSAEEKESLSKKYREETARAQLFNYVCAQLCKIHLRIRFEQPQSSKEYLRFFISVTQKGEKANQLPIIILNSKEIDEDDLHMVFELTHKDGTFMYWRGEGDIYSEYDYYMIDRMSNPVKVLAGACVRRATSNSSTLSKKNYAFVGELLHGDPQHYGSIGSIDWDTAHSYHRLGNAPTGFASSTRSITMPNINIDAITRQVISFDPIDLYNRFIIYEAPKKQDPVVQ